MTKLLSDQMVIDNGYFKTKAYRKQIKSGERVIDNGYFKTKAYRKQIKSGRLRLKRQKKLSKSICSKCPGMCCDKFFIDCNLDTLVKELKLSRIEQEQKDSEFIRKNFIQLAEGKEGSKSTYTCRKFNAESGKCTAYRDRPMMCRTYLCRSNLAGFVPTHRDNETYEPLPLGGWKALNSKQKRLSIAIPI